MTPSLITVMFSEAADRGFRLLGIRTHLFSYRGDRQVVSRAIDGYEFGLVSPFLLSVLPLRMARVNVSITCSQ